MRLLVDYDLIKKYFDTVSKDFENTNAAFKELGYYLTIMYEA